MTDLRPMRPLDAYHGNHHTFWPRLYSALGRHSRRGLDHNPTTHLGSSLPEAPASLPRLLAESRGPDAGVDPSARSIPASIFEVATAEGREAAMERASR